MDLKEARYIVSIADHQSISKAAEDLFISQPSLSKYLKNIELQLGTPLFDRLNNHYIPTYTGERYLYYARKILYLRNEWNTEFEDMNKQGLGTINIAAPVTLSNLLLNSVFSNFHKRNPGVTINLLEDLYFVAENSIDNPSIHLTFYNVTTFPKDLNYEIINSEEVVLILPKGHYLESAGIKQTGFDHPWIDLTLCKNENFIMLYPEQNTGGISRTILSEYEISPQIILQTRSSELSIRLACEQNGLTFAPASYAKYFSQHASFSYFSIGKKRHFSTLIVAYRKNRYLPYYMHDFIQFVHDVYLEKK